MLTGTFIDEGSYPIDITVTDVDGSTLNINGRTTISVADADAFTVPVQPAIPSQLETPATATPAPIANLATFTDTGYPGNDASDFSVTIDWGDGSGLDTTSGSIVNNGGVFTVSSTGHTYAEEGSYSITVTIADDAPGTATATAFNTIVVNDRPVVVTGGVFFTAVEGQAFAGTVATFTDPGTPTGEPLNEYAATIDWGDGSTPSVGTITETPGNPAVFTVSGTHAYAEESDPGTPYEITVTVQHGLIPSLGGELIVAANDTNTVVVVDTSSDSVSGVTGQLSGGGNALQTAVTPDGTQAFATDGTDFVYPITNLTSATPALGTPINIGFSGSDMSITPDGKFLLVSGAGGSSNELAVIDVSNDMLVGGTSVNLDFDIESVNASIPGIVLVTTYGNSDTEAVEPGVEELLIDGSGNITETNHELTFASPQNIAVAPGATSAGGTGVVLTFNGGGAGNIVEGFAVTPTGITETNFGDLTDASNSEGVAAVFSPDGSTVYVLSNDGSVPANVDVFGFDPTTGYLGGVTFSDIGPSYSFVTGSSISAAGVNPLALSADGTKLYVSAKTEEGVEVFDPSTGDFDYDVNDPGENLLAPLGMTLSNGGGAPTYATSASAIDAAAVSDPPVVFMPTAPSALPIFGTGLDSNGNLLAGAASDPNYTVTDVTTDTPLGQAVVVSDPATFGWASNTATSQWISIDADGGNDSPSINADTFDYHTTFDLTGFYPATAVLNLELSADDQITEIDLNGVNTGFTSPGFMFASPTSFTISSGFLTGANTLDFIVSDSGGAPTGLQVQITGTATPTTPLAPIPITLPAINEGQSVTNAIVATFTDPGGPEDAAGSYNATINWGDGTSSPGTVVPATATQDVKVNIFNSFLGNTTSGAGAPYSGPLGTFMSPDIQFAADGTDWFPLGISQDASFGADITGNLAVPVAGNYTFDLNSDDGSELFIDGNLVINNGGTHSLSDMSGTATLSSGTHSFEVQFFNAGGPAGVDLNLPAGVSYGTFAPDTFYVLGSHTYAEESTPAGFGNADGTYHITTTVQHELSTPTPSRSSPPPSKWTMRRSSCKGRGRPSTTTTSRMGQISTSLF